MSKEKATQYQYLSATGPVEFNFTNDYMFRAALQQSKEALHGLVCSVLSLNPEDVSKIKLLNPIRIGEALSDKELRMDILVLMNDNTTIDLEMQVKNYNDWPERSLSYLCREFDDLEHGENYSDVGYAYQVGFLDFTLFEDHPEFVGRYQMRNVKDNYTYTDKFNIVVVELNHTDLATVDDINSGIDNWVRLFKAKTWEDVIMIAKADTELESAAESMYVSVQFRLAYTQAVPRA